MGLFDLFKKKQVDDLGNPIDGDSYSGGTMDNMASNTNFGDLSNEAFRLTVADVFTITGRGTVVTGVIETGSIKLGDKIIICRQSGENIPTVVTGVESFRKLLDGASAGQNVGLLLRGIDRNMVSRGDIITKQPDKGGE